jgi:hypothetical protein
LPLGSTAGAAEADDLEREAWFESRIRPVLIDVCHRCHGGATTSSGLRVDSRANLLRGGDSGPAVMPGDPVRSLLMRAIERQGEVSAMPPDKERALRPEQVADFKRWIVDGAYWPPAAPQLVLSKKSPSNQGSRVQGAPWGYSPLERPALPQVALQTWNQTAVDPFILQRMEAAGVRPAPPADRRTLLRRVTFDLTGLPPTTSELEAFLGDDRPDAFARVVERFLRSPAYGERWGRHWLDVVRYADTAGETADYPTPLAWKYRNYVIDAWNRDKPYDQFIREQIAGDVFANDVVSNGPLDADSRSDAVIATGFLALSRRFGFDSENYHHLTIQDSIDTLGQAVLGLSLGCARCHDHKFDAVSTRDYYALYGVFASSRYPFPGSEQKQKVRSLAPLVPPAEAAAAWRRHMAEIARLTHRLQQHGRGTPPGLLRPLTELDGDFELQAPAAGGSNGVLVPPWLYSGAISITAAAQSPYRNVYASGKSGVGIPANSQPARFEQSLSLAATYPLAKQLFINLDYRVAPQSAAAPRGGHRVSFVDRAGRIWVALRIEADRARLLSGSPNVLDGDHASDFTRVPPGEWRNVQLTVDSESGRVTGFIGTVNERLELAAVVLPKDRGPTRIVELIERVVVEAIPEVDSPFPSIEYDQFAIRAEPFAPPATQFVELDPATLVQAPTAPVPTGTPDKGELAARLKVEIGNDGDLELQAKDQALASPWNPGPNSEVRLTPAAQSPFRDFFGPGELGLRMPNRAAYDGFGLTLSHAKPDAAGRLYLAFDFRCVDQAAGGDGTWRYFIGHGPGTSAAIELFFHGSEFFRRSGPTVEPVGSVTLGEWHQVRLVLDTKQRSYTGELRGPKDVRRFTGSLATGWDGGVDYTFIDSYGHRPGVRPALDADNFLVSDHFPIPNVAAAAADVATRRQRIAELRREIARSERGFEEDERRLRALIQEGPFPWAYAMAEGTPHAASIQRRGEPSQLGDLAPREVPAAVGLDAATPIVAGSGRRELAERITRPDHPLTARVIANRVWQYHFGQGLVKTPNDFGARGLAPTHPELLDHLACELIRANWSLKALHREILLSATYQQVTAGANRASPSTAEANRTNLSAAPLLSPDDLYAGFPRRRLGAEEIRDSVLAVTGELDRVPGEGHAFPAPPSWGFTQHAPFQAVYEHSKRSVYLMTQRLKRHPFLALFDGPDPNATTASRPATTVPTQSLFFLNDPFLHSAADRWAERLIGDGGSPAAIVERIWLEATARRPLAEERDEALAFMDAYAAQLQRDSPAPPDKLERLAVAAYIRIVLSSNEFLYVD